MIIEELYESFVLINVVKSSDGEGGFVELYTDGPEFSATLTPDNSLRSTIKNIGQKDVAVPGFKIATPENVTLKFHDIFRSKKTNQVYRVTSKNSAAPKIASKHFNLNSAEEWELPDE